MFRGGENALQVLPPLLEKIPEARLNLIIYYLRNDDIAQAHELIKDLEPSTPQVHEENRNFLHIVGIYTQRSCERCLWTIN